jgi:hypothetical protein
MDPLLTAGRGHYHARFLLWKAKYPEQYALFVRFAREAASHHPCYSIWAIASRARWHAQMRRRRTKWKVNNSLLAYISRDLMETGVVPEGFFETRTLRAG